MGGQICKIWPRYISGVHHMNPQIWYTPFIRIAFLDKNKKNRGYVPNDKTYSERQGYIHSRGWTTCTSIMFDVSVKLSFRHRCHHAHRKSHTTITKRTTRTTTPQSTMRTTILTHYHSPWQLLCCPWSNGHDAMGCKTPLSSNLLACWSSLLAVVLAECESMKTCVWQARKQVIREIWPDQLQFGGRCSMGTLQMTAVLEPDEINFQNDESPCKNENAKKGLEQALPAGVSRFLLYVTKPWKRMSNWISIGEFPKGRSGMSQKTLCASRKELMALCENAIKESANNNEAIDVILGDGIQQSEDSNTVDWSFSVRLLLGLLGWVYEVARGTESEEAPKQRRASRREHMRNLSGSTSIPLLLWRFWRPSSFFTLAAFFLVLFDDASNTTRNGNLVVFFACLPV